MLRQKPPIISSCDKFIVFFEIDLIVELESLVDKLVRKAEIIVVVLSDDHEGKLKTVETKS